LLADKSFQPSWRSDT